MINKVVCLYIILRLQSKLYSGNPQKEKWVSKRKKKNNTRQYVRLDNAAAKYLPGLIERSELILVSGELLLPSTNNHQH